MASVIVYIPAQSESYTGYTTYVSGVTSSTDVGVFSMPTGGRVEDQPQPNEILFPDTREHQFIDKQLLDFYERHGYHR